MPTVTIPYDPSLVLGMPISLDKVAQLEKISALQQPVDSARDKINELLRKKLSLDLTRRELLILGADTADLKRSIDKITKDIIAAAEDLAEKTIAAETAIATVKAEKQSKPLEGLLDPSISTLKSKPFNAGEFNLSTHYFEHETYEPDQNIADFISSHVNSKVSMALGHSIGVSATQAVRLATQKAIGKNSSTGTLVIAVIRTQKNAAFLSPIVLKVDDAVDNYTLFTGKAWQGDANDPKDMLKVAKKSTKADGSMEAIPILAGVSYVAGFIGLIHFEQIDNTKSSDTASIAIKQVNKTIEDHLTEAKESFELDGAISKKLESQLNAANIQSHCKFIPLGFIPPVKSSKQDGMKEVLKTTAEASMSMLADMQKTVKKTDYVKEEIKLPNHPGLQKQEEMDLATLLEGLDNFANATNLTGIPTNFHLKYITPQMIAQQWLERYHPDLL